MIKLMIGNQKGGVGKRPLRLPWPAPSRTGGCATLLIDSDPQGSVTVTLRLKPEASLADFILNQLACPIVWWKSRRTFTSSVGTVRPRRWSSESSPCTAATCLSKRLRHERRVVRRHHRGRGAFHFPAPGCSMVFCQNVLIPVSMDTLSVSGAGATIFSARTIGAVRAPALCLSRCRRRRATAPCQHGIRGAPIAATAAGAAPKALPRRRAVDDREPRGATLERLDATRFSVADRPRPGARAPAPEMARAASALVVAPSDSSTNWPRACPVRFGCVITSAADPAWTRIFSKHEEAARISPRHPRPPAAPHARA